MKNESGQIDIVGLLVVVILVVVLLILFGAVR